MTSARSTMSLPFDYKTWQAGTSITPPMAYDEVAEQKFESLDGAVETYLLAPSPSSLNILRAVLRDWIKHTDAEGGPGSWERSKRNQTFLISHLNTTINSADTDAALGIPDFMSPGMINARLGILYLFSKIKWEENVVRFVTSGVIDFNGGGNGKPALRTADASKWLEKVPESADDPARVVMRDRVATHLESLVLRIIESVVAQLPNGSKVDPKALLDMWDAIPGGRKAVCRFLAEKALAHVAPFLASSIGLIEGLLKATSAGVDRYQAYALGKGVVIVPGTPRTTVDGIKRAMDLQLASETYRVLKGAGSLALEGLSAGTASVVVNTAFSVVEAFVKLAWRAFDYYCLRAFRAEALVHWEARERENPFHERPAEFNEWYRATALKVPAVPCLTLASGLCGDKMRLLRMFDKEGETITQAKFDAGVKHLDNLKDWGRKYLGGLDYGFGSDDPIVAHLIATR